MDNNKNILVTGVAGFVGFHVALRLCRDGYHVYGIDNINDYYDVELKKNRLKILSELENFNFRNLNISNKKKLLTHLEEIMVTNVIHLAAQAGVRYSITNPDAYVESNLVGFMNILEGCRSYPVNHLIYASSSSVYGANKKVPFSELDLVDHPVSLYAATKKSNELLAHSYSSLYKIPTTGLRFFTVYGPFGRPDMAYFKFTKSIFEGSPIDVYNNGDMKRDFTYISDIVESIVRLIDKVPKSDVDWNYLEPNPATSFAPYRIFNIGNNNPVKLLKFIEVLENIIGKKAEKNFLPMQKGDVLTTFADIDNLSNIVDYRPRTTIDEGLSKFVQWYREYYKII